MNDVSTRPSEAHVAYGDTEITVTTSDGGCVRFTYPEAQRIWTRSFGLGARDATLFALGCARIESAEPKLV